MKIFSWRITLVVIAATSLIFHPKAASATTFDVTIAPGGNLVFSPASVTIHPGDQVKWTWSSSFHSTTSGSPGQPNGIWDSGIQSQGATFTHTFNSAGTFPYYCIPHGGCCNMVGTVMVVNALPTPTSTPRPTSTPAATPTPAPVVTTNPATKVAAFSATLNGSVNPRGATTMVSFQYGLTTSYGSTTPMQTQNGNTVRAVSANVAGLLANHTYHFRIVAHNNGGTSFGPDKIFTSLTATGAPVATTNPATFIASFSATLNGSLDPHGLATTVSFQYGTTTAYGTSTPMQSQTGSTYRDIAANISGLSPNTIYHFRIVATNSAGTRFGGDRTFTTLSVTGAPVATTNPGDVYRELFSHAQCLTRSTWITYERSFPIWHYAQLRTHNRSSESGRKHLPSCRRKRHGLNWEHTLPFPSRSFERSRYHNGQRPDLYHAYSNRFACRDN